MDNLESNIKDSLDLKFSSRPNSQEINKRYNHLKKNLNNEQKLGYEDDIVNFENTETELKKYNQRPKSRNGLSPISKIIKNAAVTSNKKVSAIFGKLLTEKSLYNELRNNFQRSLGKLNDNDTKEVGFQEIKAMISSNNTGEALRIYIGLLSFYYNNCTQSAKEIQVLLIGYMASVYRDSLLDPLDKPPNLMKTIVRVSQIIHMYLKEKSVVIQKACSLSLQELFENCMPKEDDAAVILIFFDPLISIILSGTNTFAQIGASVCLSDMVAYLGRKNEVEENKKILNALSEKIINLAIKNKNDLQYVFEALYNLTESIHFESFINHLNEIYERLIMCLNFKKTNYQTKIISLKIFAQIGKKLKSYVNILIGFYYKEIILTLENCSCDRIHKVQIAANEALKEWRELQEIHEELEKKKTQINQEAGKMNKEDLIINYGKMDKFNLLRNLSKMSKKSEENKNQNNTFNYLTENLKDEIYKKGIGSVLKLSNYLKNKDNYNSGDLKNSVSNKRNMNKSPTQKVNDKIKDFLRKSQNVNKSNSNGFGITNHTRRINLIEPEEIEKEDKIEENEENQVARSAYLSNSNNNSAIKIKSKNHLDEEKVNLRNTHSKNKSGIESLPSNNENNSITNNANQNNNKSQEFDKAAYTISSLFKLAFSAFDKFENRIKSKLDKLQNKISQTSEKLSKVNNINIQPALSKERREIIKNKETQTKILIENENKDIIDNLNKEIQKSASKEKESPIIKIWKNSIKEINEKNYEQAFLNIFESGDDLYLLRIICITGSSIIKKLNLKTSKKVIMRINMIFRSYQIQSILIRLILTSFENSSFFKFTKSEQNELLETLYEFSGINSNLGTQAADLYTKITSFY